MAEYTARESVGQRIRRLRQSKKLSMDRLARLLDVSKNQVVQIETGITQQLRPDTLERYSQVLEVPPEYILTGLMPNSEARDGQPPPELTSVYTALTPADRYALLHIGRALREARERYLTEAGQRQNTPVSDESGESAAETDDDEEPRLAEQDQLPLLSPEEVTPELSEEQIQRGINQGKIAAETPEPDEDE